MDELDSAMVSRRLLPLSALRAFEAAARHSSFKLAAAELAVTPTAVSHQIRQLEEMLGTTLFERRTRRVVLTADGRMLSPVLRDGFDAFARALDAIRERRGRRALTVSATTSFTARWLVPRAASFRAAHPALDLRLHASDDMVDLHAGAADAAVRYGAGPWPGLVAEPLTRDRFAPVCSPGLGVERPGDLRRVPLLHTEWRRPAPDAPTWRLWCERAGLTDGDSEAGTVFTDDTHAVQAAVAGQGVALASLLLVGDELARGTLAQPFGPVIEGHCHQFVCTRAMLAHDGVVALRDWLVRTMNG